MSQLREMSLNKGKQNGFAECLFPTEKNSFLVGALRCNHYQKGVKSIDFFAWRSGIKKQLLCHAL
ncbi:hypothetical protein LAD12857_14130 [Lacrimispora amygdalina]|uniref:Uncharacterized protein n=1 Tax=Lacrimispora amygdalina TaxID=253257 RepID=A0ABQ5M4G3_9FIRM